MFFFRQGELTTGSKERDNHIDVQESGEECQKGLAFICLASTFLVSGIALFILYAAYRAKDAFQIADAFKAGGRLNLKKP